MHVLSPELGNKGAQAINNAIAEFVDRYPHRFAGLARLPWQNPDEAITEMDRVIAMGFRGIMLYSHIGGKPVDTPHFEPVYAHAEALRLPNEAGLVVPDEHQPPNLTPKVLSIRAGVVILFHNYIYTSQCKTE